MYEFLRVTDTNFNVFLVYMLVYLEAKKSRRRTCRKRTRREFSSIIGMRQVRAEKRKHVERGKRKEIRGDERERVFRVPDDIKGREDAH